MAIDPWYSPDRMIYLDVSRAEHEQSVTQLSSANALLSLSTYGGDASQGKELYAAVWHPSPSGTREVHGYTISDFQALCLEQSAQGFLPSRVTAYGSAASVRVACAFEPAAVIQGSSFTFAKETMYSIDVAEADLSGHIDAARESRMRVRSLACYGDGSARRYIVIWEPNWVAPPAGAPSDGGSNARKRWQQVAWSDIAADPDVPTLLTRVQAQQNQTGFPHTVLIGPDGSPVSTFTTARLASKSGFDVYPNATAAVEALKTNLAGGFRPAWIYGGGTVEQTAYAVMFSNGLPAPVMPAFTTQKRKDTPYIPSEIAASIDLAARAFVEQESASAGAVGLAYKGNLLFHHTYSYSPVIAPPGENDRFRWASCSKIITALAAARLQVLGFAILDDPIYQTLKDVLVPPPHISYPTFQKITAKQLITHTSGVDDQWDYAAMIQFAQGRRPILLEDFCGYVLSKAFVAPPTHKVYSNAGYALLGLWVQHVAMAHFKNVATYEDAVKQLVFTPMKISNAALSGRLFSDKPADEVTAICAYSQYKDCISQGGLMVGDCVWSATPQLVAGAYGVGDIGTGGPSAGWTLTAADFALLMSSFSDGSPLFPKPGDPVLAWLRDPGNLMWDAAQQLATGWMFVKGGGMGGTGAAVGWNASGWSWGVTVNTNVVCGDFDVPEGLVDSLTIPTAGSAGA